jgi:hypothetical protein
LKLQLVGEDYVSRSLAAQAETCVNLYPELFDGVAAKGALAPGAQAKSSGTLYATPGRASFAALGHTNIRGMLSVNGRVWVVNGTDLVELSHTGEEISRHALPFSSGTGPAGIAFNGRQVLVVDSNNVVSVDSGIGCVACTFAPSAGFVTSTALTGTCNTSGSNVVAITPNAFGLGPYMVGQGITVNAIHYTIAVWIDPQNIIVSGVPGTNFGVPYELDITQVDWVSGDEFPVTSQWSGQTITIGGNPYTIFSVFSSTRLYVTTIVTPPAVNAAYSKTGDAVTAVGPPAFLDGYFIIRRPAGGTPNLARQFNISALNDGAKWNALDFGIKESYPDDMVSVLSANEQLYVFGSESLEVWQNTGGTTANPFPFSRINGSVSRFGSVSPWAQIALDGNVYFLGGDGSGNVRAYVLNGWSPVPVSTPAQENTWQPNLPNGFGFSEGAIAYGYLEEGHSFAVWTNRNFGVGQTHAYDQNTGAWHQRYTWSGSAFAFNKAEFHCFAFNQAGDWGSGYHLVASQDSGTVYISAINYGFDQAAGSGNIKWQRALPYIYSGNQRIIYGRFTLEMETGGISVGPAPTVNLEWSDDRGKTFRGNLPCSIGTAGQTNVRVYWTRTGGLSGTGGMSRGRIFRINGEILNTTPYRVAIIDAECDVAVTG